MTPVLVALLQSTYRHLEQFALRLTGTAQLLAFCISKRDRTPESDIRPGHCCNEDY